MLIIRHKHTHIGVAGRDFLRGPAAPPPFFLLHHMNKVKPSPKDSLNYIDPLTGGSVKPAAVSHGW